MAIKASLVGLDQQSSTRETFESSLRPWSRSFLMAADRSSNLFRIVVWLGSLYSSFNIATSLWNCWFSTARKGNYNDVMVRNSCSAMSTALLEALDLRRRVVRPSSYSPLCQLLLSRSFWRSDPPYCWTLVSIALYLMTWLVQYVWYIFLTSYNFSSNWCLSY